MAGFNKNDLGRKLTSFLILIILTTSCSKKVTYLDDGEQAFGTQGKNKWIFHRLSDRDKGTSLAFPGYIIGIEKADRRRIGAPMRNEIGTSSSFEKFGFNENNSWENLPGWKRKMLNDGKTMFISSIHQFQHRERPIDRIAISTIYDAYSPTHLNSPTDAFEQGFTELDGFRTQLDGSITKDSITHVFLFAMGWNSDQQEAIRNFNSMFLKIIDQANQSGKEFRPLFIGITWPSLWNKKRTNAMSFFNKTNDADEIGMTWANYLLNQVILSEKNESTFKTVVVGHSFGAKLTSRATMSASMLSDGTKHVDLLINLQSAYSINRYSSSRGIEPTEDYTNWDSYAHNVALICSEHDNAVTKGFYAPFAGGIKAYKEVVEHRSDYPAIATVRYHRSPQTEFGTSQQLLLIDASEIIRMEAYQKGGKAHSDIYNQEVATMLWNLISSKTY